MTQARSYLGLSGSVALQTRVHQRLLNVANVVLFLSSPLSDYITGIVLDINGGMYMG